MVSTLVYQLNKNWYGNKQTNDLPIVPHYPIKLHIGAGGEEEEDEGVDDEEEEKEDEDNPQNCTCIVYIFIIVSNGHHFSMSI